MQKVAIFVDVQNIYYTTRDCFKRHFNYSEFWKREAADYHVVAAIAYATDRGDSKQQSFQNILKNIGFTVKLKPYIQRRDGSSKGDWDVGITLDVLEYANKIDKLILLSGDGDFHLLLQKVKKDYGVYTAVYGVEHLTSSALMRVADEFVPISKDILM